MNSFFRAIEPIVVNGFVFMLFGAAIGMVVGSVYGFIRAACGYGV